MRAAGEVQNLTTNSPVDPPSENNNVRGFVQFLGTALAAVVASYVAHPYLMGMVTEMWNFKPTGDSSFETSFFGLVGIIYGLMGGNTFLFLYERQVNIVQELYGETFALELLLQQAFLALPDQEARTVMATCIRRYIKEELYDPVEMTSPFAPDSPFSELVGVVAEEQSKGYEVRGIVEATQKLADAQSRRSAVAAQVLPLMHWVFLTALQFIFVMCFLVFAASSEDALDGVTVERQIAFSALVGVLVLTQQVLYDLDNPMTGLYSFKPSLDNRMTYVQDLLQQLETGGNGYVPEHLQRLSQLGLVSSFSQSTESPSTAKPLRRARHGRADEDTYTGGPLSALTHGRSSSSSNGNH